MRTIAATKPLDDVRLVELSRDGDREAFGRIWALSDTVEALTLRVGRRIDHDTLPTSSHSPRLCF